MKIRTNDPRLTTPRCISLAPVKTIHENQWFTVRNLGGFFTTKDRLPQAVILPVIDNINGTYGNSRCFKFAHSTLSHDGQNFLRSVGMKKSCNEKGIYF